MWPFDDKRPIDVTRFHESVKDFEIKKLRNDISRMESDDANVKGHAGVWRFEITQGLLKQTVFVIARNVYEQSIHVRRCVDCICDAVGRTKVEFFGSNTVAAEEMTKGLNLCGLSWYETISAAVKDLLCIDRMAIEIVRNPLGQPLQLITRDAAYINAQRLATGQILRFVQYPNADQIPFALNEMIFVEGLPKTWTIQSLPLVLTASIQLASVINTAKRVSKEAGGSQLREALLSFGDISDQAYERIKNQFETPTTSGIRVISGVKDTVYTAFMASQREMQAMDFYRSFEGAIYSTFGFTAPPKNGYESDLYYPLIEILQSHLNEKVFKEMDVSILFKKYMSVPLPILQNAVRSGIVTKNEWRDVVDLEAKEGGDDLEMMSPMGVQAAGSETAAGAGEEGDQASRSFFGEIK